MRIKKRKMNIQFIFIVLKEEIPNETLRHNCLTIKRRNKEIFRKDAPLLKVDIKLKGIL